MKPCLKIAALFITLLLAACGNSEEKLINACIEGLNNRLDRVAKYGGWDVSSAKGFIEKMVPDKALNAKYHANIFWDFDVIITHFTLKNGFDADVRSTASCKGWIGKSKDGSYDAPSQLELHFTVNGEQLDY